MGVKVEYSFFERKLAYIIDALGRKPWELEALASSIFGLWDLASHFPTQNLCKISGFLLGQIPPT